MSVYSGWVRRTVCQTVTVYYTTCWNTFYKVPFYFPVFLSLWHCIFNIFFNFSFYCSTIIFSLWYLRLKKKQNIKSESHPFYHIICDWFSWGWSKKNVFEKKKFKKKLRFSKLPILNIFVEIFGIGPWVSRINWCDRHWYGSTCMVVKQSKIRSQIGKKH